jgi:hypothetical protein
MEMELYPLLSTIILVATFVTIVFALFSYLAYRAREKKAPRMLNLRPPEKQAPLNPQFFKRYEPLR